MKKTQTVTFDPIEVKSYFTKIKKLNEKINTCRSDLAYLTTVQQLTFTDQKVIRLMQQIDRMVLDCIYLRKLFRTNGTHRLSYHHPQFKS